MAKNEENPCSTCLQPVLILSVLRNIGMTYKRYQTKNGTFGEKNSRKCKKLPIFDRKCPYLVTLPRTENRRFPVLCRVTKNRYRFANFAQKNGNFWHFLEIFCQISTKTSGNARWHTYILSDFQSSHCLQPIFPWHCGYPKPGFWVGIRSTTKLWAVVVQFLVDGNVWQINLIRPIGHYRIFM